MGSGASCTKVKQFDESVQMPSISPTSSSTPSRSSPQVPEIPSTISVQGEKFRVRRTTDQYSSIWDYNAKLSSSLQQSLKAGINKVDRHQKETFDTKWTKKSSTNLDSIHVESTLSTQTHSCINLSTSEKIDQLIKNLNHIHVQQDESIRRRTEQISVETENVLSHIINETQQEQQRLLSYAKIQQTKQDEHYRDLLEKYISKLDEIKAHELAKLQEELQDCREEIMEISQTKIKRVNEQTNIIKSSIVKDEQQQASMKIDTITSQIQILVTDDTFQLLGSEAMTKTNIITNTNVGTKAPGQNCKFNFVEDVSMDNPHTDEYSQQNYTKTIYLDAKSERRLDHEEVNHQTGKKVSVNSTLQVQKSR